MGVLAGLVRHSPWVSMLHLRIPFLTENMTQCPWFVSETGPSNECLEIFNDLCAFVFLLVFSLLKQIGKISFIAFHRGMFLPRLKLVVLGMEYKSLEGGLGWAAQRDRGATCKRGAGGDLLAV